LEFKKLSRESILNGQIQALAEAKSHALQLLSDEDRAVLITESLAAAPAGEPMRVFAYGSLIWNPAMNVSARYAAMLRGYQRRFCFWTILGRGCEQNPGLMLGLEPGGQCEGVVYEIADHEVESEMDILFRREMISNVYIPTWVDVECGGNVHKALTFIVNVNSERYCAELTPATRVRHIATARGQLGNNRDYLLNLVDHLGELEIHDAHMESLAAAVREYLALDHSG